MKKQKVQKKLSQHQNKHKIKDEEKIIVDETIQIVKKSTDKEFGIIEAKPLKKTVDADSSMLKRTLDDFISTVSKSKIAVIIPLYGYWSDIKDNQLDLDVLKTVINRVTSQSHELYIILVAEEKRLPSDILNYIGVNSFAGNSIGAAVPQGSSYSDYIHEGLSIAIEDVNARFIMVVNPWIVLQEHSIDLMANRLNIGDVMIVSGFDVKEKVQPESFDEYIASFPNEDKAMNIDFIGMPRAGADMLKIDCDIKTKRFTEKDIWQRMYRNGYGVITSQRIPIYSFDIDWTYLESDEMFNTDKEAFIKKWGFNPGIK